MTAAEHRFLDTTGQLQMWTHKYADSMKMILAGSSQKTFPQQ